MIKTGASDWNVGIPSRDNFQGEMSFFSPSFRFHSIKGKMKH